MKNETIKDQGSKPLVDPIKKLKSVYRGIIVRCYHPSFKQFKDYGGRGIGICKEWYDRENHKWHVDRFINWALTHGFRPGLQLDRIDNSKGYSPDNCRFVTQKENCRNKRSNFLVTYNGKTQPVSAWAEETGQEYEALYFRLTHGWDVKRALYDNKPADEKLLSYNGETHSMAEWARKLDISYSALRHRLQRGETVEQARSRKVGKGHSTQITIGVETHSLKEWAKLKGMRYATFLHRIRVLKMTPEEALTTRLRRERNKEEN